MPPTSQVYPTSQPQQQQPHKPATAGYNQNHWLIQEAEHRRQVQAASSAAPKSRSAGPKPPAPLPASGEQIYENMSQAQLAAQQKQSMLSVSGRKKCSSCGDELGRGCAAMVIESLSLYYHINCFRCSVCHIQLGTPFTLPVCCLPPSYANTRPCRPRVSFIRRALFTHIRFLLFCIHSRSQLSPYHVCRTQS